MDRETLLEMRKMSVRRQNWKEVKRIDKMLRFTEKTVV